VNRVHGEVLQGVDEVLVTADDAVGVAVGEDAAVPSVPLVEGSGVRAVQVAHAGAEVRSRRPDEQVVVRPHQAPAHEVPAVTAYRTGEESHEVAAIVVVDEELAAEDRARGEVEGAAWRLGPERASHRSSVPAAARVPQPLSPGRCSPGTDS